MGSIIRKIKKLYSQAATLLKIVCGAAFFLIFLLVLITTVVTVVTTVVTIGIVVACVIFIACLAYFELTDPKRKQ